MAKLKLEVEIPDDGLDTAIAFMFPDEKQQAWVKKEYFNQELIAIDVNKVTNQQAKYFHTNGLVAVILNLITAQEN
jgi:hypothetical protein